MAVRALARHPSRFQPCAAPTGLRAAVGAWARSTPAAARQLHCATPLRVGGGAAKPSIVGCAWPQLRAESFFIIHARPARASPPPRAGRANSVPLGTVATLQQVGEIGFNSSRHVVYTRHEACAPGFLRAGNMDSSGCIVPNTCATANAPSAMRELCWAGLDTCSQLRRMPWSYGLDQTSPLLRARNDLTRFP